MRSPKGAVIIKLIINHRPKAKNLRSQHILKNSLHNWGFLDHATVSNAKDKKAEEELTPDFPLKNHSGARTLSLLRPSDRIASRINFWSTVCDSPTKGAVTESNFILWWPDMDLKREITLTKIRKDLWSSMWFFKANLVKCTTQQSVVGTKLGTPDLLNLTHTAWSLVSSPEIKTKINLRTSERYLIVNIFPLFLHNL